MLLTSPVSGYCMAGQRTVWYPCVCVCTVEPAADIIEIILTAGIDRAIHGTVMGKTLDNAKSLGSIGKSCST